MHRAAVGLATLFLIGCADKLSSKSDSAATTTSPTTTSRPVPEPVAVKTPEEPDTDKRPAEFDPVDARRTLRWITAISEPTRLLASNRTKAAEQIKAAQKNLQSCLRQTVKWKLPLESVTADGMLTLGPVRNAGSTDHAGVHPEMSLRVRPWNSTRDDSLFACPTLPWLSALHPGQDRVTVQGEIAGVTTRDNYDWYVALTEIQFLQDSGDTGIGTALRSGARTPEMLDSEDVDRGLAWIRRQIYLSLDPTVNANDRERLRRKLVSDLRAVAGTKVRWRWPVLVPSDSAVAAQDFVIPDYEHQVSVAVGLLLKQPRASDKSSQLLASGGVEYAKVLFGAPGSTMINPEVTAKLREAKKATLSGKVAKIAATEDGTFPPKALQIAIWLDDVAVAP
jgi:hypothetical protein